MGYIPPQNVYKADMSCGREGTIIGIQLEKTVNPTYVLWPDPSIPGLHCKVDIRDRMIGLVEGEYHIATTIVGGEIPYIQHDPHTTVQWFRRNGIGTTPARPGQIRIKQ